LQYFLTKPSVVASIFLNA